MNRRTAILTSGASFQPTRQQILNVQASFCNLFDDDIVPPATVGRPVFTPYIMCLDPAGQQDWINRLKAVGDTHIAIMIPDPVYPEGLPQYNGGWIPIPTFAPTEAQFDACMALCLRNRLIPIVFTTTGQVPSDWNAYAAQLGWLVKWSGRYMAVEGFEPYTDSPTFTRWFQTMRDVLGESAILACHLPSNYIHNGGGASDWQPSGCFGQVDVFLQELSPSGTDISTQTAGWLQCIQRMNPPGTPGVPYYLQGSRCQTYVIFEQNAYLRIRLQVPIGWDDDSIWDRQQGVFLLGNQSHVAP